MSGRGGVRQRDRHAPRTATRALLLAAALAPLGAPLCDQYLRAAVPTEAGVTMDHTIPGFEAWAVARSTGFTFQPLSYGEGQWVSEPRDGVNTQLLTRIRTPRGSAETVALARVAAGTASVTRPASGSRRVGFEFFADRHLARDWSVVSVEVVGSFTWDRAVVAGSRDLSFRVTAASTPGATGSVVIRNVVLRGPLAGRWQDAFGGTRGDAAAPIARPRGHSPYRYVGAVDYPETHAD